MNYDPRIKRVVVVCNRSEKKLFDELANRLDRNRSDAVRVVVREAVQILREQDGDAPAPRVTA